MRRMKEGEEDKWLKEECEKNKGRGGRREEGRSNM